MNDYISKNEPIEEIKRIYCTSCNSYNGAMCRACEHQDDIDIIEDTKAADVQPVDRWISCKDKMPEDNTLVLFVYVSKNGVKSVHYGYHQTLKGLGSSWAKPSGGWHYYDDDITHWQPLPEPPKDGDING